MTFLTRRDLLRYSGAGATAIAAGTQLLAAAPAAASTPAAAASTAAAAAPMAHVRPRTPAQLALMPHLDDTHRTFDDGTIEVLLRDGDLARLDEVGMDYDLFTPATDGATARPVGLPLQPGETDGDYRRSSERYEADLRALVDAHAASGRVRLLEMGTSLLGTTVYGVEIATNVANNDGRPVVMHDGMHHCREWPAGEMPIMWAHELLENYDTDSVIASIVDNVRTVVLPLVNPDGFNRTQEAAAITGDTDDSGVVGLGMALAGKGAQHRKNVRAVTNEGPLEVTGPIVGGSPAGASQPDAYGIDLNRNYPFHWGDESGSSSVPESQTYRGTRPFSEPETHNVRDLVRSRLPITHITHHTSGEQMLIPWGREPRDIRSPDWPVMAMIAKDMRDGFTGPDGTFLEGNGYDPIQAFNLYPTSGTSRDWGHACTRTIIYTFEHGDTFHDTYASTIPAMYVKNRGAFIRHSLAAMDEGIHATIKGEGPVGGTVTLSKSFQTPTNLQLSGTPVISLGGLPTVQDPTGDALRPTFVDETIERVVHIGADGTFDVRVPPSTRPYLLNEKMLDDYELGDTEPYTVTVADADGNAVYSSLVTIERGYVAEISADTPEVTAHGQLVTDPTPGDWPIAGPA